MTTTQTTIGDVTPDRAIPDRATPDGAAFDGAAFDGAKAEAFGGRIMSILTGSLLSSMVDIGHRTGLSRPPPRARRPASSWPPGPGCTNGTCANGSAQ